MITEEQRLSIISKIDTMLTLLKILPEDEYEKMLRMIIDKVQQNLVELSQRKK